MKNELVKQLNETLCRCRSSYSQFTSPTLEELESGEVFLPEEAEQLRKTAFPKGKDCHFRCENIDSFSAALTLLKEASGEGKPPLVLNFANPICPGGGVRQGARAQEEDLCRKSSLLLSLESPGCRDYYAYNRSQNSYLSSHAMILSPKVMILRDRDGGFLDTPQLVSVLTCAAPILTPDYGGLTQAGYRDLLYRRIQGILSLAAAKGYRELVLGAFGCGAFGNDAHLVASMFRKALDAMGTPFREIFFAVLARDPEVYNYQAFLKEFPGEKSRENTAVPGEKPIFFWHEYDNNGFLSNWYLSPFVIDDFCYFHVEQYLMAQKAKLFHDAIHYTAILRATTAKECKKLGRLVNPFQEGPWQAVKYEVLKTALREKFTQNPDLKQELLDTGAALLAEASPRDAVYGIGLGAEEAMQKDPAFWPGQNLLGKALMEIRQQLRNSL